MERKYKDRIYERIDTCACKKVDTDNFYNSIIDVSKGNILTLKEDDKIPVQAKRRNTVDGSIFKQL